MLKKIRRETKLPVIVVDAGNLLFHKALSVADKTDNASTFIAARGIVKAYKSMAYDAVALSSVDLSAGAHFFQQSTTDSFPFIAANVYDKHAKRAFSPHIIKNLADSTLGIIGLTGGEANGSEDFVIGDWRKALQDEIALLDKSCTILVVLSSLSDNENNELQRNFNQIDIVVTADQKGTNIQPHQIQNSLLVQSGSQGKYLGRLDITGLGRGSWSLASSDSLDRITSQKPAQVEGKNQPGKTYQSFVLPVQPATSDDTVDLIVQDIKKSIKPTH